MDIADDKIFIRLFAHVADKSAAQAVATAIQSRIPPHLTICRAYTRHYWKIPEYFEIFFDLRTGTDTPRIFEELLALLATGWQVQRVPTATSAIWNPTAAAAFVAPEVRWANVECYSQASVVPTILVLEDDKTRTDHFTAAVQAVFPSPNTPCLAFRRTAKSFIEEADTLLPAVGLMSLDHDLYPAPGQTEDPGDGLEVADHLAELPPVCPIIIHSSNTDRAHMMAARLQHAGWPVKLIAPLGPDWIEAHWVHVARTLLASPACSHPPAGLHAFHVTPPSA